MKLEEDQLERKQGKMNQKKKKGGDLEVPEYFT